MTVQSTITAKGQTTIPVEVRRALGLKPGDRIDYVIRDGRVELAPRNLRAGDLAGLLGAPPSGESLTLADIDAAIGEAAAHDDARISQAGRKARRQR